MSRYLRFALVACLLAPSSFASAQSETGDAEEGSSVRVSFEPGDGLVVESTDDQFSLEIRVRGQIRGTLRTPERNDGDPGDLFVDADDVDLSLAVRRARVVFQGFFFGRDNRYRLQIGLSPSDLKVNEFGDPTRTPLLDYYLEFRQLRDLSLRVGQYVLPVSRERMISSGSLAMVDRSTMNDELNLDRDLGVHFFSEDLFGLGLFRYWLGVSAGEGRDAGLGTDVGLTYSARIEVLPFGLFDDYEETDFSRGMQPRLAFGASYVFMDDAHYDRGILGAFPADGGRTDYHFAGADAIFKWAGLTLQAEMLLRLGTREPGTVVDDMGEPVPVTAPRDGIGWFVQADYLFPRGIDLDIAARFGMLEPIGAPSDTTFPTQRELGGAVSWYFHEHLLKLQADYFRLWEDDIGVGEHRVRLQLSASL